MTTARVRWSACSIATLCAAVAAVGLATAAPATATATATARPKVVLLAGGAAPRSPLRLSLAEGTVVAGDLVYSQSVEQSLDGNQVASVAIPPIRFRQTTTVESVGADGNAVITYTYGDVQVVDDGSVDEATRQQLETALQPVTALTGRATVTPRNEFLDSSVEGTESLPSQSAQIVDQLGQQSSDLAVPFPREAVGVGARWRATTALTLSGVRVEQQYVYRLSARDADRVTLDIAFVQTAPRQAAQLPGVPAGAKLRITKWRVTGDGSGTLELASPYPAELQTHASGTQEFSVRYAGDSGTLTQKVILDVTASSAPSE